MAAQWVDPDGEIELNEGEEQASLDELEAQNQQKAESVQNTQLPEQQDEELPEKYKGKSAAELARMHQEVERLVGRQSQEVGELRRAFDEFVQTTAQKAPEEEKAVDPMDFFADPEKAVKDAVARSPEIEQARQLAAEMSKMQKQDALKRKHPDAGEILSAPAFAEWVKGSQYRLKLAKNADAYDLDAADELFTLWKESRSTVQKAEQIEEMSQKQQAKKAATGKAGTTPEGGGKKIYRRTDIIRLMREDPKRYDDLQDDIMRAYAEGRVR